ncbi:MAG: thioesterase [Balneolaceae bacterium]|nr:thioesterase [Balneolaceae bacterium]
MTEQKRVYEEPFRIRSSEVRPDGSARLQTLCDLLQEVAGNQALELNFDVSQLRKRNLTWVLHRLDLRVEKYPKWRDRVTVRTWPSGGSGIKAYRDFVIQDSSEQTIARALSYWLMIDLTDRRPARIPREVIDLAPPNVDHVVPVAKKRPATPSEPEIQKIFDVRYSDLDVNNHVNNIRYIEWIVETHPNGAHVTSMDIEFKAECRYGCSIRAVTGRAGNHEVRSEVRVSEDEKPLATANLVTTSK